MENLMVKPIRTIIDEMVWTRKSNNVQGKTDKQMHTKQDQGNGRDKVRTADKLLEKEKNMEKKFGRRC